MGNSWTELHVGVRMHHEQQGMIFSDYSFGVGIPFFSTNSSGHGTLGINATYLLGHPDYVSCVVAHYSPPAPRLETATPCPESLPGLCMRKLARGCVLVLLIKVGLRLRDCSAGLHDFLPGSVQNLLLTSATVTGNSTRW